MLSTSVSKIKSLGYGMARKRLCLHFLVHFDFSVLKIEMARKLPLVVILGATGSGKTKLSLELAQRFKGEIIGADSMQVYRGLDIITAKATPEEQSVAPHHLIDILNPDETFTVVEYRNRALEIIERLFGQNKVPVVVGGTNYYIESILWKILVQDSDSTINSFARAKNSQLSSEELHKKLSVLDPAMARRLHPKNMRKILRSLEVLEQKGRKHSEILEEQQKSFGGSLTGGGLRYDNALIFRLECENTILDDRLNRRVDLMIEQGLVSELTDFHRKYNAQRLTDGEAPDYTQGVFQSIGFKEFHPYLMMSDQERQTDLGQKCFLNCVEELKMATRKYARKQNRWITNRFLGRRDRGVPPMYGLDVSNVDEWSNKVLLPAVEIVHCFINNKECLYKPLPLEDVNSVANSEDDTYFCDICQRVFVGQLQWNVHRKSNRHKKMVQRHFKLSEEPKEVNKVVL